MLHTIHLLVGIVSAKLRRARLDAVPMLQRSFGFWETESTQTNQPKSDMLTTSVQDAAVTPETEFHAELAE